jgi:hypothetical protein
MKLATTDSDFNLLEFHANKRTSFVRVPREALQRLIADHLTLLQAATGPVHRGGKGHRIEPGPDQTSLS